MHEESCTGLASTPQQSQGRPMGKPESGEAGLKLAPSHAEAISGRWPCREEVIAIARDGARAN